MNDLIDALAVTAELTGTELSEGAAKVMLMDLSEYPKQQVLGALNRCRKELRGRLTLADIINRMDDGRPGPEEAWAMIPKDETGSVIWTSEMAVAFGAAVPLLEDPIAARMAFKEAYEKEVMKARDQKKPVYWLPSFGTDKIGREAAVTEAISKNRINADRAIKMLPESDQVREFINRPLLTNEANQEKVAALLETINPPKELEAPQVSEEELIAQAKEAHKDTAPKEQIDNADTTMFEATR